MLLAVFVQVLVGMGVIVVVGMDVGMLVGVGHTVMGVRMGVGMGVLGSAAGNMIVVDVHGNSSFGFFSIIALRAAPVKTFISSKISPGGACGKNALGV